MVSQCQGAALPSGSRWVGAPGAVGAPHGAAGQGSAARACPTTPARSRGHRGSPTWGQARPWAQLRGPRARPGCGEWETSPAGASLGQGLKALGADMGSRGMGRDSQAWQCPRGPGTQVESKHPCPARPTKATRGRGHRGRAQVGREELWDASQHQEYGRGSRCHFGSCRTDATAPAAHSKPSPIFLWFAPKENGNQCWFFYLIKSNLYLFRS